MSESTPASALLVEGSAGQPYNYRQIQVMSGNPR